MRSASSLHATPDGNRVGGVAPPKAGGDRFVSSKKRTWMLGQAQVRTLQAAAWIARRLSPSARVVAGEMIGELGRRVDHQRYEQAQGRIVAALQVDRNRAAGIARECYRSLGRFLVECLALPDYGEPAAGELFEVRGLEHLRRAAAAGRGVLLFSAHFGNWEAAAMHQATLGLPMSLVVKPSTNGLIEKQLTLWRESSGNVMVAHRGAFKSLTRELRRGGLAGFLIDQYSSRQTLRLPFFGQLASYTPLLGFLAVRLEVPVIPLRALPLPAGRHRIDYYPPLEIPTSGTVNERVLATTTAASQLIESWIRERPGCWLWLHDRWKHRE